GKASEIVVCGFHPKVCEIKTTRHHNQNSERNRKGLRQQPAPGKSKSRYEHIRAEINDKIENVAGPVRPDHVYFQTPRKRSINCIDSQCDNKPNKHPRPLTISRGKERKKNQSCSGCSKNVDRKYRETME